MRVDVSIVLYRPSVDEVNLVIARWARHRDSIAMVWLLISGESDRVDVALAAAHSHGLPISVIGRCDNLGFASGHNLLIGRSREAGADVVLVINPDVVVERGAIAHFVELAARVRQPALIAPWLERIEPDGRFTGVADSLGIRWDSWGRHFDMAQGERMPVPDGSVEAVAGVSGACMAVFCDAYDALVDASGYFFDDFFLAYREDAELGVRAGILGVPSYSVGVGGFGHVRSVRGSKRGKALEDLLGVRNRFLMRNVLGRARPGSLLGAWLRDLVVVGAVLTVERRSREGLGSAMRLRRAAVSRGRYAARLGRGAPALDDIVDGREAGRS